jgi:PAS domain S-box-containing protein
VIELVIEAMVDAVVVVDAEGKIMLSNAGAEQLSEYTRDQLRGLPIGRLLADDDSSGLRTLVRRRIAEGDVVRREDSWLVTARGVRIPVSVTGSPVLDERGALHGIVIVARDTRELRQLLSDRDAEIVRRRTAEDELRTAKASIEHQLEEARRMLLLAERRATLGTLAGGVGHELRNIAQIQIAAVDELASALAADEDVDELARQLLPELQRVGDHITLHGQKLMQLARPGPDHVAPIDLNEIVRDVVVMLRLAGKLGRVQLELALAAEPLCVTVNRTRIEQILVNLVTNAVDAIGDGDGDGTVTIDVRPSDDGKRVVCAVRDTGSGIAAGELTRIFEPFYTTKGPERGTGLGLSVVREIVAAYGGTLRVHSEEGHGTSFTFELPR